MDPNQQRYILAFDTANEAIAVGVGALDVQTKTIVCFYTEVIAAHRASNTRLVPYINQVLTDLGVTRDSIACIACGRGPGSFTGVRIAMATAKGMASALGVGLIGMSTLDIVAWNCWSAGVRGNGIVVADAMRHEVYPVRYNFDFRGVHRLESDRVLKVEAAVEELSAAAAETPFDFIAGDALTKYSQEFSAVASLVEERLWEPDGSSMLLLLSSKWRAGEIDPYDPTRHDPAYALPVYTRLSDAEENERMTLPKRPPKNLVSGVQGEVFYKPLDATNVPKILKLDSQAPAEIELRRATISKSDLCWLALEGEALLGYAFGSIVGAKLQIRRHFVKECDKAAAISRELLTKLACDARDLAAATYTYEPIVGSANTTLEEIENMRPLSDLIDNRDVAGMTLAVGGEAVSDQVDTVAHPLIFAIESSCDETAASIIDGKGEIVASVVASQIDFHARFGGVVPEIASRKHIEAICGVCEECFEQAAETLGISALNWGDMDSIAVTYAPGLVGALVVGVAFAKGAAWAANKPFIGVNHLEGHLYANRLGSSDIQPPLVASLVSGGNTMLVHVKDWGDYETLGTTLDDAVGEAFDKVAKALGLGYPGGPVISRYAAQGNPKAIAFPRAMLHSGDLKFSLSGLKTAVITYIHEEEDAGHELNIPDIAASFQAAVIDVQVAKTKMALEMTGAKEFCLGGGVAANPALRAAYEKLCGKMGVKLILPPMSVCGDNAAMIALVALDRFNQGKFFDLSVDAYAHADLDEPY